MHVIEGFEGRGGAETLFLDLLPTLSRYYRIVLVTLKPGNSFGDDVFKNCYGHYCLRYSGFQSFFSSVKKLKKIIRRYRPILVRSQLTMGNIIARMASPNDVPFIFSVHSALSIQIKKNLKGWGVRSLEKLTLRKTDILIGVSQVIVDDYRKKFSFHGKSHVLYNYVRQEFFSGGRARTYTGGPLHLISIGNLRHPKNYFYLIDAFKLLLTWDVYLDIYGNGPLEQELQKEIDESNVHITLKGGIGNTFEILNGYHGFVMVSSFEGFGIAVAEAMAAAMPLILSDISVFREITEGNAFFVDISSAKSFSLLVTQIMGGEKSLNSWIEQNKKIAMDKYSKDGYIRNLLKIYSDSVSLDE